MPFETFIPIWSHVNEKENKSQESNIWNFKILQTSLVETLSKTPTQNFWKYQ